MSGLVGVLAAAAEVEAFCRLKAWRFCFIGGIAVQRWGMPRFTQDIDLTLFTGLGPEADFVDAFLSQFAGRLRDARQFALQHRVILARTGGGVDVDVALGALSFEETSIRRATPWPVAEHVSLTTCSAEDLIVHKVFAGRDRDWADVESVLARQHGRLDLPHVRRQLAILLELKDDVESLGRLERLMADVARRLAR